MTSEWYRGRPGRQPARDARHLASRIVSRVRSQRTGWPRACLPSSARQDWPSVSWCQAGRVERTGCEDLV